MSVTEIKQIIKRELPTIMRQDEEIRQFILYLTRTQFGDKAETESRFDRLLDELRRDREEQSRRWAEQNAKWDAQNRKWDENQRVINQMLQEIGGLSRKHDSTIGALEARWGLYNEGHPVLSSHAPAPRPGHHPR
jgi:hypothetical protein